MFIYNKMAILDSSSVSWLITLYVLGLSAISFYIIYIANTAQFINDYKWMEQKNLKDTEDIVVLRRMRDVPYNLAIALVIINFLVITTLIFNKYKVNIRV